MKARMWGVLQVSVNTSVMMWLPGMGGTAAIHSEWHCSLVHMGLMVPQISQPFAIFGSRLPEVKFRYSSHQPRSCFWNMSASLTGMSDSASWVVLIYHLVSPKGNMRSELSLCSGSALCVQPPGNVHLHGCKGTAIPVFPEFTAQQSVTLWEKQGILLLMSTIHKWHFVFITILFLANMSANTGFQTPFFLFYLSYFFSTSYFLVTHK